MPTLIVTGVCGFIGAHVAKAAVLAGWRVVGVDRRRPAADALPPLDGFHQDELDQVEGLADLVAAERPQALIHAAGPARVEHSFRDPRGDLMAQIVPWTTTLEAVRRACLTTRVVLCSSAAVYGAPAVTPISEQAPVQPISPYGWHKLVKETLLAEYVALHGLSGAAARIFSTFGPGLDHLAVYELARKALAGDFTREGQGGETRDYLFVEDVAAALLRIAVAAPCQGEAINVAAGVEIEIADLARRIAAHYGKSQVRLETDGRPGRGKPARWRADVGRLAALGFAPRVSFAEALGLTLDWIAAHD